MENQAHHIQALLANELDKCKGKGNIQVDNHIKTIQEAYQDIYYNAPYVKLRL